MSTLHGGSTTLKAQAHVQEFLRKALTAHDDKKVQIARDLQDALGQPLTALRLVLEQHEAECRVSSRAALDRALTLAREIDAEIDALAWELRPRVLNDPGLAAALRQLVRRWADCGAVDAQCSCDVGCDQLSPDQQVTVYRLAQEALHNVLKHAHATHVHVLSEIRNHVLILIVQDDGVGFESRNQSSTARCGFRRMHQRAALVGGALQVESSPGYGTTVFLRIPLLRPGIWPCAFASLTSLGRVRVRRITRGLSMRRATAHRTDDDSTHAALGRVDVLLR